MYDSDEARPEPKPTFRIGDRFELESWYDPARLRYRRQARKELRKSFERTAKEYALQFCDVSFETVPERDPRAAEPPLPAWRLMIGSASVIFVLPDFGGSLPRLIDRPAKSFLQELDIKDLERLRAVTRKVWAWKYPDDPPHDLTIDGIINEMGAATAEKLIRRVVDAKMLS